jgi:hypothetical protein
MKWSLALALLALAPSACSNNGTSWGHDDRAIVTGDQLTSMPDLPPGVRPDATHDGAVCGEAEFNVAREIVDMLIILDRSNSMNNGIPFLLPGTWENCGNAINAVTAAMDLQIWFGLFVFPSSVGSLTCDPFNQTSPGVCAAPNGPVVPVKSAAGATIKGALAALAPCGGTPTAKTLVAAKTYLQSLTDTHTRYVLLATDGGPNCNDSLNVSTCNCPGGGCQVGGDCLDDTATYAALDDLCAAGIKTYIMGLSSDSTLQGVLQKMAQHGCTTTPYSPTDATSIQKAFGDISTVIATCSFDVDCTKVPDAKKVNFYFDGKVVPNDPGHTAGWDWSEACVNKTGTGKVEFFGADCTSIKSGAVKAVSAKFGCPTVGPT